LTGNRFAILGKIGGKMPPKRMKIANLDDTSIEKLKQMEESLGTLILALEPHHPLAELKEDQIQKLRQLENDLGVVLIAYKA
jgi:hypothetical protein